MCSVGTPGVAATDLGFNILRRKQIMGKATESTGAIHPVIMKDFPLSKVFHLFEPGPVVLVTTAIRIQRAFGCI